MSILLSLVLYLYVFIMRRIIEKRRKILDPRIVYAQNSPDEDNY